MLEEFIKRNLSHTVEFLARIGHSSPARLRISIQEQHAAALQRQQRHSEAYQLLLCPGSRLHIRRAVFCACCSPAVVYLRNSSLRDSGQMQSHSDEASVAPSFRLVGFAVVHDSFRPDPFTDFLVAAINRDVPLLLDVISTAPLFWDAFVCLVDLSDSFTPVDGPLSPYYYMLLKVKKDIDPPGFNPDCIRPSPPSLSRLPYPVQTADPSLLGAFLYACGDTEAAHAIFSWTLLGMKPAMEMPPGPNSHYVEAVFALNPAELPPPGVFVDLAAAAAYSLNDPRLPLLVASLQTEFPNRAETLAARGILHVSLKEHARAKRLFARSLQLRQDAFTTAMLAHTAACLGDRAEATTHYSRALQLCPGSFRIYFSAAHGYHTLGMHEEALYHATQALGIRSDSTLWKLVGRIHMERGNYEGAVAALSKAERMGEPDALLYLAELAKKTGNGEAAPAYYERYVEAGAKSKEAVIKYLVEYFNEIGDHAKAETYRAMVFE